MIQTKSAGGVILNKEGKILVTSQWAPRGRCLRAT